MALSCTRTPVAVTTGRICRDLSARVYQPPSLSEISLRCKAAPRRLDRSVRTIDRYVEVGVPLALVRIRSKTILASLASLRR